MLPPTFPNGSMPSMPSSNNCVQAIEELSKATKEKK